MLFSAQVCSVAPLFQFVTLKKKKVHKPWVSLLLGIPNNFQSHYWDIQPLTKNNRWHQFSKENISAPERWFFILSVSHKLWLVSGYTTASGRKSIFIGFCSAKCWPETKGVCLCVRTCVWAFSCSCACMCVLTQTFKDKLFKDNAKCKYKDLRHGNVAYVLRRCNMIRV